MQKLGPRDGDDRAPPRSIRIAAADDAFLMREAISRVFATLPEIELVSMSADGDALRDALEHAAVDVVVTDLRMPPSGDDEGIRLARWLAEERPDVGVVLLSQYLDARCGVELLLAGGVGGRAYLLKERVKDAADLMRTLGVVAHGGVVIDAQLAPRLLEAAQRRRDSPVARLTPRERDVLAEMAHGLSNAAIATSLVLSKRAVEKHVGSIFQKLDLEPETVVSRRVAAMLLYLAEGAADAPAP